MIKNKHIILKQIREGLSKGAGIGNACSVAGITSMTLWRWRKKYKRIDRYMESLTEHRVQLVEDALYKSALKGNNVAQMFFLKVNRPKKYNVDRPLIDQSQHLTQIKNDKTIVQVFNAEEYAEKLKELNGKSANQITKLLSDSLGVSASEIVGKVDPE